MSGNILKNRNQGVGACCIAGATRIAGYGYESVENYETPVFHNAHSVLLNKKHSPSINLDGKAIEKTFQKKNKRRKNKLEGIQLRNAIESIKAVVKALKNGDY